MVTPVIFSEMVKLFSVISTVSSGSWVLTTIHLREFANLFEITLSVLPLVLATFTVTAVTSSYGCTPGNTSIGYIKLLSFSLSPFNPHTDVRCMRLWLECFPYLQGCLQVSGKYLVAGITLNQLKGRQMVIYMVWMVEYRS